MKSKTETNIADDIDDMEEVVRFYFVMEFRTVSQKHLECFRLKCQNFSTVHWVCGTAQCIAHKFDCWRVSDEDDDDDNDDDEVKEEFLCGPNIVMAHNLVHANPSHTCDSVNASD